jgi:FkbM family methyltransferase
VPPQSKYHVIVPHRAALLRRLFGRFRHVRGIPRLLFWTSRFALPFESVLVNTPDGLPLTVNPNDYGQLMMFYFPYCLELQALLADILKPGDVCFDLGANIGIMTMTMADLVGATGRVIAVEPNPAVTAQLNNTIQQYGLNQITVVQAGIAGQTGTGYLAIPNTVRGGSESVEVTEVGHAEHLVHLVTVDELVNTFSPGRVPDFIKFDIEGHESEVLETMEELLTLGRHPVLLIEFHPQKVLKRGRNVETVRERLQEIGYQEFRVAKEGKAYKLWRDPSHPAGRENILYVTPDDLTANPKLRSFTEKSS